MPTLAEKLAKKPTAELQQIIDDVQAVANDSQSFAYRFEDQPDGSRLEIRCAPIPRLTQIPDGPVDHAGSLVVTDGKVLRVFPQTAAAAARTDLENRVEQCDEILAQGENSEVQQARDASTAALEHLALNLAEGEQTGTHVAIAADDKTAAYIDELGAGGHALIPHQ